MQQALTGIAHQAHLGWVAQTNPFGINVDLDGTRLVGLGVELNVGEGGADEEERIAAFQRLF